MIFVDFVVNTTIITITAIDNAACMSVYLSIYRNSDVTSAKSIEQNALANGTWVFIPFACLATFISALITVSAMQFINTKTANIFAMP